MLPFKLEAFKYTRAQNIAQRTLYTKNKYDPIVKVSNWQAVPESRPYDMEPDCTDQADQFRSHYKRLGDYEGDAMHSETERMLGQAFIKVKPVDTTLLKKPFMNYFSYRDTRACDVATENACPYDCVEDYVSSMHASYKIPHKYWMKGLKMRDPIGNNRRMRHTEPYLSPYKFHDEGYVEETKMMQKKDTNKFLSYNPCLGVLSNGEELNSKKLVCFKLDY